MAYSYISLTNLKLRLADSLTTDDAIYKLVLEAVAKEIDNETGQTFRTFLATRYYSPTSASVLDLDVGLLATPTTLKTDENADRTYEKTWAATDYDLLPYNAIADEKPYRSIALAPLGTLGLPKGLARSVEINGKWGWFEDLVTSSATLNGAHSSSVLTIAVSSGAAFDVLQTMLIDSEQMYITAISSNNLTVERGVNGTTAASHLTGATIKTYRYPGPVTEAAAIQTVRLFRRKDAPFGVVGGGDMTVAIPIVKLDPDVKMLLQHYKATEKTFA